MDNKLTGHMPYIEARCRSIRIPGFEPEDIKQEAVVAVLVYLDECEAKGSKPTEGAVRNIVHRHIYKLIRENVTFDGCVDDTKSLKKAIRRAGSNIVSTPEGITDLFEYFADPNPIANEELAADDMIEKFKSQLTPTETTIFQFMMEGHQKPREICLAMHGVVQLNTSKTISNHTVKIKEKFAAFWLQETGKVVRWKK